MPATQQNRFIAIKTALGPDNLLLKDFSVTEQLGRMFQIEAELVSEDGTIDFDKVVGFDATIRLNYVQQGKRFFNGYISRLVQVSNQGGYARYRATIVPWLWFLTRTSDCRTFQKKTAKDIIEEVFKGHGFKDYQLKLSGNYVAREFCVQYRETDFNFVSRLMEQEGIYYFFQHEDGKHTMVLTDSAAQHKPDPDYASVSFSEVDKGGEDREAITEWNLQKELQSVAFAVNDFDFHKPKTPLLATSNVSRTHGKAQFEIYDYPGEYVDHGEAQRLADVRIQELQTQYETAQGQASARGLAAGCTFKLANHPRPDQNREYLLTGVTLHADAGAFDTSKGDKAGDQFFSCSFSAIPKTQQFRPVRLTPKPFVQGPQTAMVVGPAGETIHCDNFGRIKVKFHWDRQAKSTDDDSCWIRVSQPWGGKGWGGMFIPHVGQEVIVVFEEGDPDRPLISGRVYNPDQMPPVALPAGKSQSAIRDHGGNEIIMEGAAGAQKMRLYSPTHETSLILGNSINISTLSDLKSFVKGNHDEKIEGNEKKEVKGESKESIIGKREIKVGADLSNMFIGAKKETTIGMTMGTFIGANYESKKAIAIATVKGYKFETDSSTKYELNKKDSKKKSPSFMENISTVKSVLGDVVRQIKGEHALKGAKKLYQQAKELETLGDNGLLDIKGDYQTKVKNLREEAKEKIMEVKKLKQESDLFTLLSKLEVNNGAFSVEK